MIPISTWQPSPAYQGPGQAKSHAQPEKAAPGPQETFVASPPAPVKSLLPTLIILDSHSAPPSLAVPGLFAVVEHAATQEVAHGDMVSATARAQGFSGRLLEFNTSAQVFMQHYPAMEKVEQLWDKAASPQDLREALYLEALNRRCLTLDYISHDLEDYNKSGVKNCALNVSMGTSLASSVQNMLEGRMGPDAKFMGQGYQSSRFCQAFGLDVERFRSPDPAIAGAETSKLIAHAMALVESTSQAPELLACKSRYDKAVTGFEQNQNSLVVGASNEGDFKDYLALRTQGQTPPPIPAGYAANDLAHPLATVVGATTGSGPQEKVADYSSDYAGVNFYALGETPDAQEGTSFAAPRVAALMAQLRVEHPGASSAQLRNILSSSLGKQLPDYQGHQPAPVLDLLAAQEYLIAKSH